MGENVLGQARLKEDVFDFHSGDESVAVRVGLFEQVVEPESLAGVDAPGNRLHSLGGL